MYKISTHLEQSSNKGDDSLFVKQIEDSIWFCVADGAGGTGSGDVTSKYIVDRFADTLVPDSPDEFENFLRGLDLELVNSLLGGMSTAVIGRVKSGIVYGASVGDSEAWIFDEKFEHQLTSFQHRKPLLGSGNARPIGFGPMQVDRSLLIGSDGLFKYASFHKLRELIADGSEAAKIAAQAKLEIGKLQDDIAVILIERHL